MTRSLAPLVDDEDDARGRWSKGRFVVWHSNWRVDCSGDVEDYDEEEEEVRRRERRRLDLMLRNGKRNTCPADLAMARGIAPHVPLLCFHAWFQTPKQNLASCV